MNTYQVAADALYDSAVAGLRDLGIAVDVDDVTGLRDLAYHLATNAVGLMVSTVAPARLIQRAAERNSKSDSIAADFIVVDPDAGG